MLGPEWIALPEGGTPIHRGDLWPCGECGAGRFEVVHRILLDTKDPDVKPRPSELITAQCPACCALGPDGRNRHGKRERRRPLGWLDMTTGELTLEIERGNEPA